MLIVVILDNGHGVILTTKIKIKNKHKLLVILVLTTYFFNKEKYMKIFKFVSIINILILLVFIIGCSNKINENAQVYLDDLDIIDTTLIMHTSSSLFNNCSQEQYDNKLNSLKNDIQTKNMTNNEINCRIRELCAMLNNSHISYNPTNMQYKVFPIQGKYFGDDFCITNIEEKNSEALGGKLIEVNDIPFSNIENKYDSIISNENIQILKSKIEQSSFRDCEFDYLGILKKKNTFKIKLLNGEIKEFIIDPIDSSEIEDLNNNPNTFLNINTSSQIRYKNNDIYWYTIDSKNRILYFQYNLCIDKFDKQIDDYFDFSQLPSFTDFENQLHEYLENHINEYDKIVVDVRNNQGGYEKHFNDFIENNLQVLNSKKVYMLISKNTFSAGAMAVDSAVEKCNAIMVGEETGSPKKLNSCNSITLPNMKGNLLYANSQQYENIYAGKNSKSDLEGLIPDIVVSHTIENCIIGKDEDYEAVIND